MLRKIPALFLTIIIVLVTIVSIGCGDKPSATTTTAASVNPSTTAPTATTTPSASTPANTTIPGTTPPKTTPPKTTTAQPPAQVSGLIYYRNPAVSYPVDAVPAGNALEGAKVSVSNYNIVTGASGQYTIPGGTGYQTITVSKDGYIPTTVSWDFTSGQSYVFNIGLYKVPSTITPRTGFINGIITWDAGGWLIDYYYKNGLFQPTYTNIADKAGGNLVTVSDPVFIKEIDPNRVIMGTTHNDGDWWRMMNEAEYTALVKDAHGKGLEFMLWLGVIEGGDPDYGNVINATDPNTAAFWNTWFAEYEKYAVQYAVMAEKLGIEYINLGHDMGFASGTYNYSGGAADCYSRWQKLITAIRAVYSGKLTYFGGASIIWGYEDDSYAPGFVELFDAIGINVQAVNKTPNPSMDELKQSVKTLLDRYTSWPCPVFVMVRTPSVDGGTSFETYIEPLLVVNHEADNHAMNVWQQADIYEAFYEVINQRPSGNGQVMGIFPWGYNYLDNYLKVPGKSDGDMAFEKSGNIRGKPAEAVIKFWGFR